MSSAIITRFYSATNRRGPRVGARCGRLQVTLPWDHALLNAQNHQAAAVEMARRMEGTVGRWIAGQLENGDHIWVHDNGPQSYLGETFNVAGADAQDEEA